MNLESIGNIPVLFSCSNYVENFSYFAKTSIVSLLEIYGN